MPVNHGCLTRAAARHHYRSVYGCQRPDPLGHRLNKSHPHKRRTNMTTKDIIQGYFDSLKRKSRWDTFLADGITAAPVRPCDSKGAVRRGRLVARVPQFRLHKVVARRTRWYKNHCVVPALYACRRASRFKQAAVWRCEVGGENSMSKSGARVLRAMRSSGPPGGRLVFILAGVLRWSAVAIN